MSKHYHIRVAPLAIGDIPLPTGEFDSDDVAVFRDAALEDANKTADHWVKLTEDAGRYFGASVDTRGLKERFLELLQDCLVFPLDQVADYLVEEEGPKDRWWLEHSTYRAVNGRVA